MNATEIERSANCNAAAGFILSSIIIKSDITHIYLNNNTNICNARSVRKHTESEAQD